MVLENGLVLWDATCPAPAMLELGVRIIRIESQHPA